jgi:hypothetical protein
MVGSNIKYEPAFETITNKKLNRTLNIGVDQQVSVKAALGRTDTVNRSQDKLIKTMTLKEPRVKEKLNNLCQ